MLYTMNVDGPHEAMILPIYPCPAFCFQEARQGELWHPPFGAFPQSAYDAELTIDGEIAIGFRAFSAYFCVDCVGARPR